MFGVTTACVTRARKRLEGLGYEVVVFHMTGSGGRAMEALTRDGYFAGVLDLKTTELADELVGASCRGPITAHRRSGALRAAGGLPRRPRSVTLMRTTPEECAELGARLASRLSAATALTIVLVPRRGVSAIAGQGGPFHDPAADDALFAAVREGLAGTGVEVVEVDTDINDPDFADAAVDRLHDAVTATSRR